MSRTPYTDPERELARWTLVVVVVLWAYLLLLALLS